MMISGRMKRFIILIMVLIPLLCGGYSPYMFVLKNIHGGAIWTEDNHFAQARDFLPVNIPVSTIQASIDGTVKTTATVNSGVISFVPQAVYSIDSQIEIDKKNIRFVGDNATIKWEGADSEYMIHITDSSRTRFENLILLGNYATPPLSALYFEGEGRTAITNENIVIEGCILGRRFGKDTSLGGSADVAPYGRLQAGILIGGKNRNNDEYIIRSTQVHSCDGAAIAFENSQSIWSSIENTLCNDSDVGIVVGCNLTMYNVTFNRIRTCDIQGIRNSESWIYGLHSEHAARIIESSGGASFFVIGGDIQRNDAIASQVFKWNHGGSLVLDSITTKNLGGGNDTIYYRSGTRKGGVIRVTNCTLLNGALRDTWDIDTAGAANAKPVEIDIDHGSFKWRQSSKSPYIDRQITAVSVASGKSAIYSSGSANSPVGTFFNVAYQSSLLGQHLTVAYHSSNQIRARVFNPTSERIKLTDGRLRWMAVEEHIVSKASGKIDVPLMANNTGYTATLALPGANLGDYVLYASSQAYANSIVTCYVSSADTVSIRIHNASGGPNNPNDTGFYIGKIKEFGNFQNTAAYTPAPIAHAATISFTVPVVGAQLGGHTFVAYTNDLKGLICTASVSATDMVTVVLTNYTGAAVTLDAGHFNVMVAF